ncbi:MAG TPA: aldo/keto reductase [Candidatus Polarisedimenticolaceae bacterium]
MNATSLAHYRLLGRSGLRVSPLTLGTMTFGEDWGWGADRETSRRILDRYLERGGNFIDTANLYTNGTSESLLGDFLEGRREQVVLATKFTLSMRRGDPNGGGNQRKNLVQSLEASLRRLRTDRIDLYWVHAWDGITPVDETMRALDDAVRLGKILYVGVSDYPAWKVAQANTLAELSGWTPFRALQVEYSLVQRDVERELVPMARELGLGITPWAPLAGGVLTGKYTTGGDSQRRDRNMNLHRLGERTDRIVRELLAIAGELGRSPAQVAIRWCLERPGVTSPILGARNVEQLEDNLGALAFTLSDDQRRRLDEASAIVLGWPHDFLAQPGVRENLAGGTNVVTE